MICSCSIISGNTGIIVLCTIAIREDERIYGGLFPPPYGYLTLPLMMIIYYEPDIVLCVLQILTPLVLTTTLNPQILPSIVQMPCCLCGV